MAMRRLNAARGLIVGALVVPVLAYAGTGDAQRLAKRSVSVRAVNVDPQNAFKRVAVGPGNVEDSARQVVRTAGGRVYVFAGDDTVQRSGGPGVNVIHAWKGNIVGIPTAFAEVDAAHHPVAAGGSDHVLVSVDVRLDSAGVARVIYVDETDGTLYYRTFSTATDTWGPASVIATGVNADYSSIKRSHNAAAIVLDATDHVHLVYVSGLRIYYIKQGATGWTAPVVVSDGGFPVHPQLAFDGAGNLHLSWLDADDLNPAIKYAEKPAGSGWLAPETVDTTAVNNNSTGDQGPSIAVTQSGRPYILWNAQGWQGCAVKIKYRTAAGWVWENPTEDLYTHAPQIYTRGDDVYAVLGHDIEIRFGYDYKLAGQTWAPYTALTQTSEGTFDGSADVRWDPLHETDPSVIDATFFDEDKYDDKSYRAEIYYMALIPPGSGGDLLPPKVSLTAPANGSTVTGIVALRATASDNVEVSGVTFLVDGVAAGPEDTVAPYELRWNSMSALNGVHRVTAQARDGAGHVTTSTPVRFNVLNPRTPPRNALVASYTFDAGSGNVAADSSGKGNDGSIVNATWTTAGKKGGALDFDGTDALVTIPDSTTLRLTTRLTVEAWVRPSTVGGGRQTVVLKERPVGVSFSLYADDGAGRPAGRIDTTDENDALGTTSIPANQWTQLAITYDGTALRLYVDGTLVTTTPASGLINGGAGALEIGGNALAGEWFSGTIDEVRIYNTPLTAAQIKADLQATSGARITLSRLLGF
jgi:concanavalin A-like lectin/glucanase superfamily protein/Big-like domain-containing protein